MNKKQLNELISLGEGFTVEFKRSGTRNISRELCAFANATGGYLLIGVDDNSNIVGVNDSNKLRSDIQTAARNIDPPLVIDIDEVADVLVVSVPTQNSKPYSHSGRFYLREGSNSQQLTRDEIREFFFKEGVIHYDATPCKRFKLEKDLSPAVWKSFAERASVPESMDPISALENLHLMEDHQGDYQ